MTHFETEATRLLNRLELDADQVARRAQDLYDARTRAAADEASAEAELVANPTPDTAERLASAQTKLRAVTAVIHVLETNGGPAGAKARALSTSQVDSTFSRAFADRIAALEKLVPPARKQLAARRAQLTEDGIQFPHIEHDPLVRAWREYLDQLQRHLAAAEFGRTYSDKRGEGYQKETFGARYAGVAEPLPAAPNL